MNNGRTRCHAEEKGRGLNSCECPGRFLPHWFYKSRTLIYEKRAGDALSYVPAPGMSIIEVVGDRLEWERRLLDAGLGSDIGNFRKDAACFIASVAGDPVGVGWRFNSSRLLRRAGYGRDAFYLGGFFVKEEWRGRGIYGGLLMKITDTLPAGARSAVVQVAEDNMSSRNGLEKAGFRLTGSLEAVTFCGVIIKCRLERLGEEPQSHREAGVLFDGIADDYTARARGEVINTSSLSFARRREIVENALKEVQSGSMVLDYGMGPALFAPAVISGGCSYTGIDISAKMVEKARAYGWDNCTFLQGDLNILADFRGSAGAVLAIGLIDYLDDPADGIRKLAECVKEGGRMIISFRNRASLPYFLRAAAKWIWRMLHGVKGGRKTAFTSPVLENAFNVGRDIIPVLKAAGFKGFSIHYLDCSPLFFNVPLTRGMWNAGLVIDRRIAGRCTAWLCASGVLVATGKQG